MSAMTLAEMRAFAEETRDDPTAVRYSDIVLTLVTAVEAALPFVPACEWAAAPLWRHEPADWREGIDCVRLGDIRRFYAVVSPFAEQVRA